MQQGRKEGADTAEGGQFFHWQQGSEGRDGGEPTCEMGRTEEQKQRCSPTEFPPEGCHEVGNDTKSGRRDAAEGGGESSRTSSTQDSPRKPKSRNARKRMHEKKGKDRNRGEAYKAEHDEERGKE